jgi:hypothetical protein
MRSEGELYCSAFNVQLRLSPSLCRTYFKWTVATLLQSVQKYQLLYGTGGAAKEAFAVCISLSIFLFLWPTTTLNTFKSQLNTPE